MEFAEKLVYGYVVFSIVGTVALVALFAGMNSLSRRRAEYDRARVDAGLHQLEEWLRNQERAR